MKRWFAGLAPCTARHAVLIAFAITLPSSASLALGTRAQRMACAGDVWRLCSSAIPSVDRIVACLKRERARLSPGCQAVFNDPEVQAAINRPPAAAPGKATPHAPPEQAANTPAAPAPAGAGPAATERPNIVTRSLSAPLPEEVASATPPAKSGAGRTTAPPTERVASRDVDSMTPVSSRHGRQQREAYHQSSHRRRSGNRYGGIMGEIAPLIAMAMGGGQGGGGFDVQSMIGGQGGFDIGSMMGGNGGRGNFDVGQIMGMARSMGFDPGTLMSGGGYWR
jgi:hypothetical protein